MGTGQRTGEGAGIRPKSPMSLVFDLVCSLWFTLCVVLLTGLFTWLIKSLGCFYRCSVFDVKLVFSSRIGRNGFKSKFFELR